MLDGSAQAEEHARRDTMNTQALQREIFATNTEKGWHDEPLCRRLPPTHASYMDGEADPADVNTTAVLAKLALIHSELVEAEVERAGYRLRVYYSSENPQKPEGYCIELADVVIRSLDTCEALGLCVAGQPPFQPPGASLHAYVAAATEAARVGDYTGVFVQALAGLWRACHVICEVERLDLMEAIQTKMEYNKTRPHRHGGKLA